MLIRVDISTLGFLIFVSKVVEQILRTWEFNILNGFSLLNLIYWCFTIVPIFRPTSDFFSVYFSFIPQLCFCLQIESWHLILISFISLDLCCIIISFLNVEISRPTPKLFCIRHGFLGWKIWAEQKKKRCGLKKSSHFMIEDFTMLVFNWWMRKCSEDENSIRKSIS